MKPEEKAGETFSLALDAQQRCKNWELPSSLELGQNLSSEVFSKTTCTDMTNETGKSRAVFPNDR